MKKASTFILPDWVDAEAWADFEAHRKEIKKPLTDRARELAVKKLACLNKEAQRKTINRSVESRWTGLHPKPDDARPSPPIVKRKPLSEKDWRNRQKVASEQLKNLRRKLGKVL